MAINTDNPLATVDFPEEKTGQEMYEEDFELELVDDEGMALEEPEEGGSSITQAPHDANLAEVVDEATLGKISSDLLALYDKDKNDRSDWEKVYKEGLALLGFENEEVTQPWDGASGVFHPLLTEAVIRFQSQTVMEVYPASGPARTKIVGEETPELQSQSKRVERDINYHITERIPDYREELELLLFNLPLAGSAFKKVYFDSSYNKIFSRYVPADDFVVPYGASNLKSAPRYTHVIRLFKNELRRNIMNGQYRDVDLGEPATMDADSVKEEKDSAAHEKSSGINERYTILEIHADYDLEENESIDLPYIFTIEKDSGEVLSIRRNWIEGDDKYEKVMHFVHYPYIPGLGFYGLGLIHIIGGIAKASTSVLRQLLDAGTLANLPGGMKTRGMRVVGDGNPINPGEWRDVDVVSGSLRDNIMPLPYKEPSAVLSQLLGMLVDEGRKLGSMADIKITDMSSQAPVGTTLALIERATKIMSAVHARVHAGLKAELKLISDLIFEYSGEKYEYLPEEAPFSRKQDFNSRVDVVPVSDPNASTMAQRVVTQQAVLDLARQNPEIYNLPKLHRQSLEILGAKNVDELVPMPEEGMQPVDPVTENMAFITQKPTKAFELQDHEAHIKVHMDFLNNPRIREMVGQSPNAAAIQGALEAHIAEHLAYHYRDQIEKHLGTELPPIGQPIPPEIDARLSSLIADASQKLLREEADKIEAQRVSELIKDPVAQLQFREQQLKEEKFDYDKSRDKIEDLFKSRELDIREAKIGSDEKIAGMRAALDAGTKENIAKIKGIFDLRKAKKSDSD